MPLVFLPVISDGYEVYKKGGMGVHGNGLTDSALLFPILTYRFPVLVELALAGRIN
jgi:hypothetical protein